jgi:hypothetical protein
MKVARQAELLGIFSAHDSFTNDEGAAGADDNTALRNALSDYFHGREEAASVLGIDIYRYSKMRDETQRLIPALFEYFHHAAAAFCADETLLFGESTETLRESFIPTGDGGFQVLKSPFQAFAFAVFLQLQFTLFNGFFVYPKLREFIGPLTLRYSITTSKIFAQDSNFYGDAIIRNARILASDRLNRCLIDEDSVKWFQRSMAGIENLLAMTFADLKALPAFPGSTEAKSPFLFSDPPSELAMRAISLQQIGTIDVKQTPLSIYNVHAQVGLRWTNKKTSRRHPVIVTLGNLNSSGIA